MYFRNLATLVLLIVGTTGFSQPVWLNRIGTETGENYAGFAADFEGNYYITGIYNTSITIDGLTLNGNDSDLYVAKFDKNGNIIWLKGESSDAFYAVYDLITTPDGGYCISGIYFNADAQFGNITLTNDASGNPFIARYDKEGNVLWARGESGSANYYQLAIDHTGSIIFLGEISNPFTFNGEEQPEYGDRDIIFGKYASDGTPLWIKVLPGLDLEYSSKVAIDAENNILITGRFFSNFTFEGISFNSYGNEDAFILKTDSEGSPVWVNVLGDDGNNRMPAGLGIADNGNIYLSLSVDDGMYVDAFTINTLGLTDMCLLEINPDNGAVNWYQTGGGYDWDYAYDLVVGSNGVFVCGTVNGDAEFGGLQLLSTGTSGFMIGYNFDGSAMELTPLTSTSGAHAYNITSDERGGALVAGVFNSDVTVPGYSTIYSQGASDIFICKVASELVPIQQTEIAAQHLTLWPNPATTYIQVDAGAFAGERLQLFDLQGNLLSTKDITFETTLDISTLPSGTYVIQLINTQGEYITQPFIKQ